MSKQGIKNIIGLVTFLLIILLVFTKITWLFRGNGTESREDILGFDNEKNQLDVILFDGSDLLRFYDPLVAWNECGYTSYNYATSSAEANMLKYYAEESRITNDAKLYVFDMRTITFVNGTMDATGSSSLRNWSDAVPVFSLPRLKGVASYIFTKNWREVDIPSYFLDIIMYHDRYEALANPYQWSYLNKRNIINTDKGFEPYLNHTPFDIPVVSTECGELSKWQEQALEELLDYCEKEKLNVLFICSPIVIKEEDVLIINATEKYITDRGYTFIDFNKHYDEIGLNFETDYGDVNHVNYYGAQKFTDYFMKYLTDNYDLPDHRGDDEYVYWNADYESMEETRQYWGNQTETTVNSTLEVKRIASNLSGIKDFQIWLEQINNGNFIVAIKKNVNVEQEDCLDEFASRYAIDFSCESYAGIWQGMNCAYADNSNNNAEANIGVDNGRGQDLCRITFDQNPGIFIATSNYQIDTEGIRIVVYDCNYKQVIDAVSISVIDGEVLMKR